MKNMIDFVKKFPIAVIVSILLVGSSFFLFASKGLNYGVDFKGGAEIQIGFEKENTLTNIRAALVKNNFEVSSAQSIGESDQNQFLIKLKADEKNLNQVTDSITDMLKKEFQDLNPVVLKTDIVGPKAGEELRISGFQAMAWALIGIMIYIGLRFDFKYSPGAIVALVHDVAIILGIFAFTQKEFSLQIVGALLAVIGYSVNDTVVVYDRVREHEVKGTADGNLPIQINTALNETLTRTILTSITTLIVSLMMYSMGGGIIQDFFFAISIGVLVGTYSSIFVAAPTVLFFSKFVKS